MVPRKRFWASAVILSILVFSVIAWSAQSVQQTDRTDYMDEPQVQRDMRMEWWREARFGMFIHWGLYAVPAGVWKGQKIPGIGEWIMASANIPVVEYAPLAKQFNPVQFDAARWVGIAKSAGMKYIVITSKHHDGFSLWDSKVSDYNVVVSTPYGKDILAQLTKECRRQGVKMCFYHSILDWHHPAQYVNPDAKDPRDGHARNKIHPERKEEYVRYMKAQLKELITNYDPAMLWFDGEWVDWWMESDGKDLYNFVRSLKNDIIVNNRVGKGRKDMQGLNKGPGYAGDFGTPEQEIPATGQPGVDWESCMTMNDTWGYKSFDNNWKSTENLIRNLVDIASKGGNYLLNVGPTAEGLIPEASVQRLAEMGKWMNVNGEAVYETTASPFEQPKWGRFTKKPGFLYAHVFDWPTGGQLRIPAFKQKVSAVTLLAPGGSQPLQVKQSDSGLVVLLPDKAPSTIDSVVRLELASCW
jgi:alpha-L-fucosidase